MYMCVSVCVCICITYDFLFFQVRERVLAEAAGATTCGELLDNRAIVLGLFSEVICIYINVSIDIV